MTIDELINETLTQKHRRLMQEKCVHEEIYSSTVISTDGAFTNSFCWDCGKSWHSMSSTTRHGPCQCCGETKDLKCGPSRFGAETWACADCWEPDGKLVSPADRGTP